MGILENFLSGNTFTRTVTTFIKGTALVASASRTDLGGSFILLGAQALQGTPCRLRLYSDQSSMLLDADRSSGNFDLTQSVALVADIVLNDTNKLTFNPPVLGTTYTGGTLWFHLSGSSSPAAIQLEVYPIGSTDDSTDDRSSLFISGSTIPTTGFGVSGSINSPKGFIIISGSATSESRLRLYSRPATEVPLSEITRSFDTQSQDNSLLIADLMFDSASFRYPLVPLLEAYTWEASNTAVGSGQIGYVLQNRSAGTTDVTASVYVYSIED